MIRFKDYIAENKEISELNKEFIKRATRVTSFNLTAKDFESLQYKKEIQHLFNLYFFPNFDLKKTIKGVDERALNKLIDELKSMDRAMFTALHKYNLKGVGPGEVVIYFLVDDAHLGGGSSAGVDLVVGSKKYEIKAVNTYDNGKYVRDFKVGGTFSLSDIVTGIQKLAKKHGIASGSEVSTTKIRQLREKHSDEFAPLEKKYQEVTYNNYFKNHDVIFMKNSTSKIGEIISIKRVGKSDITIDTVTSGTIKPLVKL